VCHLTDSELADIAITRGDIDDVSPHREIDSGSIPSANWTSVACRCRIPATATGLKDWRRQPWTLYASTFIPPSAAPV